MQLKVPSETCRMFVPAENSVSSFPADQSVCSGVFGEILVQSSIPSFFFFISVSLRVQENIFAFMITGVSAHSLPSQHLS